jgi:hypothetical protein
MKRLDGQSDETTKQRRDEAMDGMKEVKSCGAAAVVKWSDG